MTAYLVAAAGLVLAVVLLTLRAWRAAPAGAGAGDTDDADWRVLVAKRAEIDADVTLSPQVREQLRTEWAQQADAVMRRSAAGSATSTAAGSANATAARSAASTGPGLARATGAGRNHAAALATAVIAGAALVVAFSGRWDEAALMPARDRGDAGAAAAVPGPLPMPDHPGSGGSLDERIAQLEARLRSAPADLEGWVLLARSRRAQRDYAKAVDALERALALAPGHPDLLAELADMLAMQSGKSLAGRPTRLAEEALQADPRHPKALSLAATAAMDRGDVAAAAGYWRRLRATFPEGSPEAAQVDSVLAGLGTGDKTTTRDATADRTTRDATADRTTRDATANQPMRDATANRTMRDATANQPMRDAPANRTTRDATADQAMRDATTTRAIEGRLRLAPALAAQAATWPATATLFVLARVPGGPPMPVAVQRLSAAALARGGDLPFRLDDRMGMAGSQKLSALPRVDLEARVALGGNAARQAGDLFGITSNVAVGAGGVTIVLDSVVR